jgi:hypothetical protein
MERFLIAEDPMIYKQGQQRRRETRASSLGHFRLKYLRYAWDSFIRLKSVQSVHGTSIMAAPQPSVRRINTTRSLHQHDQNQQEPRRTIKSNHQSLFKTLSFSIY